MKINNVLIERGKMGKDRVIINLDGLEIPEEVPVYLNNDKNADPIGKAFVRKTESGVFADIEIPSKKDFLKLYPVIKVGIELPDTTSIYKGTIRTVTNSKLRELLLLDTPNVDPKILPIGKKPNLNSNAIN